MPRHTHRPVALALALASVVGAILATPPRAGYATALSFADGHRSGDATPTGGVTDGDIKAGGRTLRATTRSRVAVLLAAAATLVATALTGCSAPTHYGNNPSGVATSYFHLLHNKDFSGACRLFTDELLRRLRDCPAALRRAVDGLPPSQREELANVSVRTVPVSGQGTAEVLTQDVRVTADTTPKVVRGTPRPRSTQARSFAAYSVTNGKGLRLVKVGSTWKISDCGL